MAEIFASHVSLALSYVCHWPEKDKENKGGNAGKTSNALMPLHEKPPASRETKVRVWECCTNASTFW